jgi:hypothetical protein
MTQSSATLPNSQTESVPLIILVSGLDSPLSDEIQQHYLTSDPTLSRWNRLAAESGWIYMDMDFLFTRWDIVWGDVKKNLQERIAVSRKYIHVTMFCILLKRKFRNLKALLQPFLSFNRLAGYTKTPIL